MAYMRGHYYLWHDESGLHLWSADGYDGWDQTGWDDEDDDALVAPEHRPAGQNGASGVCIPQDIIDDYVMMRLAQIVYEGTAAETIERAVSRHGNTGGMMLERNAQRLKALLSGVRLEPAPPYRWDDPPA